MFFVFFIFRENIKKTGKFDFEPNPILFFGSSERDKTLPETDSFIFLSLDGTLLKFVFLVQLN